MRIRKAVPADAAAIAAILMPVIRAGESYALDRAMGEADALLYWTGPDRETFVAEEAGAIVGTYYVRANQAGGGDHVCNCGYMTAPAATGRGIARRMAEHSLDHVRACGFRAMQYNFVVSTNVVAVAGLRHRRPAAGGVPASGGGFRGCIGAVPDVVRGLVSPGCGLLVPVQRRLIAVAHSAGALP